MMQTILFAIDGSICSERGLYHTASLAHRYRTRVIVVHAYLPPADPGHESQAAESIFKSRKQAEALVEEAVSRLREMGAERVESEVIEGPAVNVIIGAAESHQPDILVIGARGQSLWTGIQLGSVSMAVVQRVSCSVLVIK